jgi:2-oxo-3-hexenedioate decarboxylase/2-keto-4-pentenoate hydratase
MTVEAERATAVAALLVEARRTHRALGRLPEALAPRSIAEAYAFQDRFAADFGPAVVGHKVGCASEASQRLMRTDGPMAGRVFASECFPDGARLAADRFFGVSVEAEFAFVMDRDLPPRDRAYGRDDVAAAVREVLPIVEICDTRLAEWRQLDIAEIIADNAFAGGFVLGQGRSEWRDLDLGAHEVSLLADGALLGRGPGRLVMGHPLDSLAWLASHLSARGLGLKQGDLVAAGTCTGLHPVRPGTHVTADFGSLGGLGFTILP